MGGGAGYLAAVKRLNVSYEDRLIEENEKTREFYSRLHKTGEYSTPDSAVSVLIGDAADALRDYRGEGVEADRDQIMQEYRGGSNQDLDKIDMEVYDSTVVEKNIFEESGDDVRLNPEHRDHNKPYVITEEESMENDPEYDHINLTYYAGDNVLSDDEDGVIEKVEEIVGIENLGLFGVGTDNVDVVFVRNDRMKSNYEISRRADSYSVVVLSFDEKHIQHSDEPMRRKRHLRDD